MRPDVAREYHLTYAHAPGLNPLFEQPPHPHQILTFQHKRVPFSPGTSGTGTRLLPRTSTCTLSAGARPTPSPGPSTSTPTTLTRTCGGDASARLPGRSRASPWPGAPTHACSTTTGSTCLAAQTAPTCSTTVCLLLVSFFAVTQKTALRSPVVLALPVCFSITPPAFLALPCACAAVLWWSVAPSSRACISHTPPVPALCLVSPLSGPYTTHLKHHSSLTLSSLWSAHCSLETSLGPLGHGLPSPTTHLKTLLGRLHHAYCGPHPRLT